MDIFNKFKKYIISVIAIIIAVVLFHTNQQLNAKNVELESEMQILNKVLTNLNEQRKQMNQLTALGLQMKICKDEACKQNLVDVWNQTLQAREKLDQELPSGLKEILDNAKK